jgi:selenophosphate synthetase-related protein
MYDCPRRADGRLAGRNAVSNANDIYAMGGRPIALLDTLLAPTEVDAEAVLRGIAAGGARYGIPVLGGHLTIGAESISLAAFIAGRARRLLSGRAAVPGDRLLLLTGARGSFHETFPFWDCSAARSDAELREDLEILPAIAEAGLCDAARDVSMHLEVACSSSRIRGGRRVDLPLPARPSAGTRRALRSFPDSAFLLAWEAQVRQVVARAASPERRCVPIGRVSAELRVELSRGDERACLWDFGRDAFTGFGAPATPASADPR